MTHCTVGCDAMIIVREHDIIVINKDGGAENIQFQITLQEDEDTEEDRDLNTGV